MNESYRLALEKHQQGFLDQAVELYDLPRIAKRAKWNRRIATGELLVETGAGYRMAKRKWRSGYQGAK
jgi:hypothetical protein